MQKLSLIFGLLCLWLPFVNGQISAIKKITLGHHITYDSKKESLYIPCRYSSYQVVLRFHDKPNWYTNTGYFEPITACNSFRRFKCYDKNWSNYAVYKGKILALSFNAIDDSIPYGYGCKNPYIVQQNDFYLTYRDRYTDPNYPIQGSEEEGIVTDLIQLENYKEVTEAKKGLFFYDFIVEEDMVYLALLQEGDLYIYQADDTSELLSSDWRLLSQIAVPLEDEYFLITRIGESGYIVHTTSQGEYHLSDFKTKPRVTKRNDKNLEDRIFIEDIYTDKVYEVTLEEFQQIELADNYGQAIHEMVKK